jgi:murein DD-endopeptidase MepM/ murein hydrolase activator NlpD
MKWNIFNSNVKKSVLLCISIIILIGFIPSQNLIIPVDGANSSNYNLKSFWYYPWGKSGTHKGVDIFASVGTKVEAPSAGFVLVCGKNNLGGNYVLMLSSKWRLHYFAHLSAFYTSSLSYVKQGDIIAAVGNSGNAKGKSPHLHYEIMTLLPYFWQVDQAPQGYKKMWYVNPISCFTKSSI